MSRPSRRIRSQQRAGRVRGPDSILWEGAGAHPGGYGWVSNDIGSNLDQNITVGDLADFDTTPMKFWFLGEDRDQSNGYWMGGPRGYSAPPYPGYHKAWWNSYRESGCGMLPAVTRCTEVITNPLLRTDWRVTGPDGKLRPIPLWLQDPMLYASAPGDITPLTPYGRRLTSYQFWDTVVTHALWFGCGGFVYREGFEGRPLPGSFMLTNPFMTEVDDDGHVVIDPAGDNPLRTDFDGRFELGGNTWRYNCLRGMAPNDGRVPEGVLSRHFDLLRVGCEIKGYISDTFRNGVPSGFLRMTAPNATEQDAHDLKSKWMKAHGTGRRGIAVLNATTDFTPISIKPVDSDIKEIQKIHLMQVAHAFSLSSAWLDTGDGSLTYSNLSDRRRDLVDHTLTAWGDRFMEVISSMMPFGSSCHINWSSYTSPNVETMVQPLVMAVQSGIMTVDEAREYLQLEDRDTDNAPRPREAPDGFQ